MTPQRQQHRHLTVACDLDGANSETRISEWQALRERYGIDAVEIPDGARLSLRVEAASVAESLVQREAQCCGFLDFEITSHGPRLRLDITSPKPEGARVAALLAGIEPGRTLPCS